MIKIIIVEDNKYKMDSILKLLREDLMIAEEYITPVYNIKDAKILLNKFYYDLLILDLVLPLEDGDDAKPEKGIGFLQDIEANPMLNAPIHIIGLTEFTDLQPKFNSEFNDSLWHLINYSSTDIGWQKKLKKLIFHLDSTKNSFFEKHLKENSFDIAIVTALSTPEFEAVLKLSDEWNQFSIPGDSTIYYSTIFSDKNKTFKVVAACSDQMGMTATAELSTKMCLHFAPNYIIMSGICAGLKERGLNLGDIIVAEQTWDYGSGKMKENLLEEETIENIFEPDPRPLQLCPELKAKIINYLRRTDILIQIQTNWKSAKPQNILQAKLGPLASGSYVVSSKSILKDIQSQQRKLLGIEMEAYGLFYAGVYSYNSNSKPLVVKSVSDYGDSKKNDGFQEYAAYTSAQFIYRFIMDELTPKN